MHEKYLSRNEILDRLKIGYPLFRKLRSEGAPDPEGAGKASKWPLYQWCEWITSRQANGTFNHGLILRAAEILRERDGVKAPPPAPIEPEVLGAEPDVEEIENTPGLEHALERLRLAEILTFSKWKAAHDAGGGEAAVCFRDWKESLDLMRKAEQNLDSVLTARRDLLPAHEVKAWLADKIEATKAVLTDLPGKIAPELEGLPWPEIQKRLTEEVRDALRKLQNLA